MDATTETSPETPAAEIPAAEKPAAAAVEKTFDQEVAELAGVVDATVAEPEAEKPAEEKPAGEEPAKEPEKQEEPAKPEEEKKPASDMARRLALEASTHRKNELRGKELDTREAKLKPLSELADKVRAAGADRVAVIRELLGGDEQFREFYLEATDHLHEGTGDNGEKKTPRKPAEKALTMEDVTRLVAEGVKKGLEDHGAADLATNKAAYVALARRTIDASPEKFPFVFSSPPTDWAITAISDAILEAEGDVPSVETVLKRIEDHRRERHEKATKKAQPTKAPEKPAAAAAKPSKTSGENPKPTIRGNDVPIVKPTQKSFDDEIAELANRLNRQAAEA